LALKWRYELTPSSEVYGKFSYDDVRSGTPGGLTVALLYLLLLVTGLVLWWPRRWPPSWHVELRRGLPRALFDVHRVGGAALGGLIAVSVASGAYMAWRPLGAFVSAVAGVEAVKPPALPQRSVVGTGVAINQLVATAQARFPEGAVGYVQWPAGQARPVRVRLQLPDDPHPNGLTSVWLDPRDGAVLAAQRWTALDPGARAVAWVNPLHTGELGGVPLEIAIALGGLCLAGLGISGLWLWWRRRSARLTASATRAQRVS
jgi:uncharacterized iron-regulated membrane protein